MAIAWLIRNFPTVAAYRAYLRAIGTPPQWITGQTVHHSVVPTEQTFLGYPTMVGIGRYYERDLGWNAGPHLFVHESTGIWTGTPLSQPGIHAGRCNRDHIGIEVVGDYDHRSWSVRTRDLVVGVLAANAEWVRMPMSRIEGHRDCLANKTCPGLAISLPVVREWVERAMWKRLVVTSTLPLNVRQGPGVSYPVAAKMQRGDIFVSDGFIRNESGVWFHRADKIGFSSGEWLTEEP